MNAVPDRWRLISDAHDHPAPAAAPPETIPDLLVALRSTGLRIDRMSCADVRAQLAAAIARPIDTVVCTMVDADATVPLNAAVAEDCFGDVRFAVEWLANRANAARAWYVVGEGDPPRGAASVLRVSCAYPHLHPSLLLPAALGRRVRPGRMPTDVGVIAIDASAAWVLARLIRGEPVRVPAVIHDSSSSLPRLVMAGHHHTIGDILAAESLGTTSSAVLVGPRLLNRIVRAELRLADAGDWTIELVTPSRQTLPEPCSRCGWCHAVCPAGVEPVLILEAAQSTGALSDRLAEHAGINECLRCGLCQYVCPSRLPLMTAIGRWTPPESDLQPA